MQELCPRSRSRGLAGARPATSHDRRQAEAARHHQRGNKYLRSLLIHGARAALPSLATTESRSACWLRGLSARAHRNTVIVAVASNLARIAWAVLRSTVTYSAMIGVRPAAA